MVTSILLAALLASSSAPLVRAQQGTTVRVPAGNVLAYFPFTTPGCYATGSALGTKGQALTVSRASSRTCPISAGEQTCTANQACVTELGLLVEPARVQLYPVPATPAAGTVTFTATGVHQFWVVGSGSQALSVSGTLVATGLPCTATAASPCTFTVTTLGATPTGSLGAVTGSLTRGQIEAGVYASSFITSGTRNADLVSIANPFAATNPVTICLDVTATPQGSHAWGIAGSQQWILSTTPDSSPAANDVQLQASVNAADANVSVVVFDTAGTSARGYSGHSFTAGSAHRLQGGFSAPTTPSVRFDAVSQTVTQAITGTGLITTPRASMYLGGIRGDGFGGNAFGGFLRELKFSRSTCR